MRKFIIGAAVAALSVLSSVPVANAQLYAWGGRNYCWYYDGWHGPGYYWCGYRLRRGYGWGGGMGWHGWGGGGYRRGFHAGYGGGYHGGGGFHGGGHAGGGFHGGYHGGGGFHGGGHAGGGFHGGGGHGGHH
ncbi:MAG TPA: hypothetical protein VGM26_00730 [Rhizomicrobium sp.]